MKIYKGGTVVFDYQPDGTCQVYRERWYHRIKQMFFGALHRVGLWS